MQNETTLKENFNDDIETSSWNLGKYFFFTLHHVLLEIIRASTQNQLQTMHDFLYELYWLISVFITQADNELIKSDFKKAQESITEYEKKGSMRSDKKSREYYLFARKKLDNIRFMLIQTMQRQRLLTYTTPNLPAIHRTEE